MENMKNMEVVGETGEDNKKIADLEQQRERAVFENTYNRILCEKGEESPFEIRLDASMKKYPAEAREMIQQITEEDIKKSLKEQIGDSRVSMHYVKKVDEKGNAYWTSAAPENTIGVTREICSMIIKTDAEKKIAVFSNIEILSLRDKKPEIKVYLWARDISDNEINRASDDGRCLDCEGWGCWKCGFTGGY